MDELGRLASDFCKREPTSIPAANRNIHTAPAAGIDDPIVKLARSHVERFPIGKAAVVRAGKDLSIITYGAMVHASMEAAELVAKEGVSVEILDMRSILPFDEEAMLESVAKTNRAIVLYEAPLTGGVGAEFAARIAEKAFDWLDAPIKRVASLDTPVPYAPALEDFHRPSKAKLIAAAKELLRY
jgi:pyruvate/2-oxoglutarate/acetoin dehydrogenase E1 component